MTNRERNSLMGSSARVGRCAMSTVMSFRCPIYDTQGVGSGRATRSWECGRGRPRRSPHGGGAAEASDAAALRRADAVVRLRRHVVDRPDLEAGGLERADRGLASRAGALDE